MDKEIVKNSVDACSKLCPAGWAVEAKIEEQSRNGVSVWMVGLFFTHGSKQKFAGRHVESEEEAEEMLPAFEEGIQQYEENAPKKKKKNKVHTKAFEPQETDDENLDEEDEEDKKQCGCGPHTQREKVGEHLICKHGFCLCGWQDDGIRQLGKVFGADLFVKTTDKAVLGKIQTWLGMVSKTKNRVINNPGR